MIHHWHNEFEIILVRSGKFTLSLDGKKITLENGDCSLVQGGALHGGIPENCVYDCLLFDMSALLKCSPACQNAFLPVVNRDKKINSVFSSDSDVALCVTDAIDAILSHQAGFEFKVIGKLLTMLGIIIEKNYFYTETETNGDIKKIKKFKNVLNFIEEHYREPITLEDMALQCDMNRNYFCRAFKEYTQKTPVEYLNYYRIESACEQIVSTDDKLIDIAMNCGFNDYSYFIKVFKSQKGMTPREFCRKSF